MIGIRVIPLLYHQYIKSGKIDPSKYTYKCRIGLELLSAIETRLLQSERNIEIRTIKPWRALKTYDEKGQRITSPIVGFGYFVRTPSVGLYTESQRNSVS